MHILCPHCRNPIEVVKLSSREEITCPACGSTFHLESGSTTGWEGKGGQRLGKFVLIDVVGQGAFGTVYQARDPELDRVVALKVPRSGNLAGPHELDRFLREARAVAQLRHPSIISVHEVGQADGVPYLVSEYARGVTLSDMLSARRPGFGEAAELVAAVAEALHYAHGQGVVHRDVKPSNIIVGEDGKPSVMDFGLAKRDAGEITMTVEGQVLGTPAYMPPEQARGEGHTVDARGDVYSMGVVLYQLLTGELPFRGTSRMLLHQVLNDEPKAPRALNDAIPRDLETVTLKAMAKEPGRRYTTAKEMADDLRRWLGGEAILARPVGRAERAWRWYRRNQAVASLSAALAILVLSGLVVGLVFAGAAYARNRQAAMAPQLTDDGMAALQSARASKSPVDAERYYERAAQQFAAALAQDPDHEPALRGRMDLYRDRCRSALAREEFDVARGLVLLLRELAHDEEYEEEIAGYERQATGRGSWKVETDPPGCTVKLAPLDDQFNPGTFEDLGKTPLVKREVPMGKYVARLSLDGYLELNCPVYVGRGESVSARVAMVRRQDVPPGMVYVPAGEFRFGDPRAGTERKVYLEGYFIDRTEVTGAEYERFVKATRSPPPDRWDGPDCPPQLKNCAVCNVTWFEAMEYARWAGKRLPTEEQWEKAARGPDGRLYPWGDRFEAWRCNSLENASGSSLIAGLRRFGASPYGCLDMAGNVWEWTLGREKPHRAARIIRGGAAYSRSDDMLSFRRQSAPPGGSSFGGLNLLGFRCVKPLGTAPPERHWLELMTTRDDLDEAAVILNARQDHARVRVCAKKLLGLNPRSVPGNYWESLELRREGKLREALARMQVAYFRGRQFRSAPAFLAELASRVKMEKDPPPMEWTKVHGLLNQGWLLLNEKKYQEAEGPLKKILEVDADNEMAHEWLAEAYRGQKRPAEAAQHHQRRVELYRAALKEDPDNADLHNELADFLVRNGLNLKEALTQSGKSIAMEPTSPVFLSTAAEIQFKLRNLKEALRLIELAIRFDPETEAYKEQRRVYRDAR